ncbi:MAG TPA: hypothetical protein PKC30_07175 [Saprospiraceae bacterium]|nr:hypothetical protein [Saprospiraceae bacterium]
MKKVLLLSMCLLIFPLLGSGSKVHLCPECWGNNCNYCITPSIQGPEPERPIYGNSNYPKICQESLKLRWSFDLLPSFNSIGLFILTRSSASSSSQGSVRHLPGSGNFMPMSKVKLDGFGYASDDLSVVGYFWIELELYGRLLGFSSMITLTSSMQFTKSFPSTCC